MRNRKLHLSVLLLVLITLPLILVACSPKSKADVTVKMTDFAYDPAEIMVKAGQSVKIELRNEGAVVHDFSVPEIKYSSRDLAPGETKVVEVTFPKAGEYDLICTVPGHEALGMVGKIIVTD